MTETTVRGEPLERWTICAPRPGGPTREAIQGVPAFVFHISPTAGDALEEQLRRVNKSTLRRGVPLLYRGEREVLPERADAEEERQLQAAQTSAQDPGEAAAAYEALNLRDLRRQLVIDVEARRRELETLTLRIEETRRRLEAETERQDRLVAAQIRHNQKLVEDAQAHYEGRLRKTWETETGLEDQATASLGRLGQQVAIATEAKRQIDRVMRSNTMAEWVSGLKEVAGVALNSPLGEALQAGLAARVVTAVAGRTGGRVVDKADAMAAFVLQGRGFRERQAILLELKLTPGVNSCRAEAAALGAQFVAGTVELRTVAEYIARRDEA